MMSWIQVLRICFWPCACFENAESTFFFFPWHLHLWEGMHCYCGWSINIFTVCGMCTFGLYGYERGTMLLNVTDHDCVDRKEGVMLLNVTDHDSGYESGMMLLCVTDWLRGPRKFPAKALKWWIQTSGSSPSPFRGRMNRRTFSFSSLKIMQQYTTNIIFISYQCIKLTNYIIFRTWSPHTHQHLRFHCPAASQFSEDKIMKWRTKSFPFKMNDERLKCTFLVPSILTPQQHTHTHTCMHICTHTHIQNT